MLSCKLSADKQDARSAKCGRLRQRLALGSILFAVASGAADPGRTADVVRSVSESDSAFAARALALPVSTEINVTPATWNGRRTLFVDYETTETYPQRSIVALQEARPRVYRTIYVTVGEQEGGDPDVAAIGFANADHDAPKELIVILVWRQYHYGACGPIYEVRIFDDAKPGQSALRKLPISKHFGDGCAPERAAKYFHYTTVADVKRELRRMGY